MIIESIAPHEKQKNIITACLDKEIKYIIAICGRQMGKTTVGELMAMYWALNKPGCTVFWVSPKDSQSLRIYKEIVDMIVGSGAIASKKMAMGDIEIVFKNTSKILFRSAASEDNLRGPGVEYMILDEAAFIKKDTFESILSPMLLVKGKKCLFITTPKGKNWIYDFYLKGQSLPTWRSFRYSTYDSPLANEEFIESQRETMSQKHFQQEIMAEFVDSATVFSNLSELMILQPTDRPDPSESYYGGIDIGLIGDASVLSIIDSKGNLVNYVRWEKVESPELIRNIVTKQNIWNFKCIYIEDNNQGLNIYQHLKRQIKNIIPYNTNSKTKPELINNLIHSFNMKDFQLIDDEYLRIELEAYIFKQSDTGRMTFTADNGFHDDCVMSLAIARECFRRHKKTVYDPNKKWFY